MAHPKHAERFLVDLLLHIKRLNERFEIPQGSVRTLVYNDLFRADLNRNGTYTLERAGPALAMRGNETVFREELQRLNDEVRVLERKHNVTATPSYQAPHPEVPLYVPCVQVQFNGKKILASIGKEEVRIYFEKQPKLPAKSLGQWYPDELGMHNEHGSCLRFSPLHHAGKFERNGRQIFNFTVRNEGEEYFLNSYVALERKLFNPVEDKNRERHGLPALRPQYNLADFLQMIG